MTGELYLVVPVTGTRDMNEHFNRIKINIQTCIHLYPGLQIGDCYLRAYLSIVATVHLVTRKVMKVPLHLLAAFLSHFLNKEGRFIPPDV